MTARMEKVRKALGYRPFWQGQRADVSAALAEVEETETRQAQFDRVVAANQLLTTNANARAEAAEAATGVMVMAADDLLARVQAADAGWREELDKRVLAEAEVERWHREALDWQQAKSEADDAWEAAEAEADRLKAALTDNNVWITAMLQTAAIRDDPGIAGANARMRLNDAALAPADRNTT